MKQEAPGFSRGVSHQLCRTGITDGMISFTLEEEGVEIIDPWFDPTGRFPLTDEEAIKTYGEEAVEKFIRKCIERVGL